MKKHKQNKKYHFLCKRERAHASRAYIVVSLPAERIDELTTYIEVSRLPHYYILVSLPAELRQH